MVVLACGTREPQVSDVDGIMAIDFLLQHPSVLQRFARLSNHGWRSDVMPRVTETDSSEEALPGWKRSVAGGVVVPMFAGCSDAAWWNDADHPGAHCFGVRTADQLRRG